MDRAQWTSTDDKIVDRKELKQYMKRDDWHGLLYLVGHLSGLGVTGFTLFMLQGSWWSIPVFIFHGALIAFLFAPMHEACHNSAFKTRGLNRFVGHLAGLIIMRPFLYLKYRHMAHHTFTQHPEGDPDRVPFPKSYGAYLLHILGYNIWPRLVSNLLKHSLGRFTPQELEFLPSNELGNVTREARLMLTVYAAIAVLSVTFQSWLAVYLWLAPRIVGESVLRGFRMAEHTGMEESPNMLANTRTTKSNFLIRAMYWNMPYHVEHHLYPSVPFHALPRLHKRVAPHAKEVAPGFLNVHAHILRGIGAQSARDTTASVS